jgi:hypothetical protein
MTFVWSNFIEAPIFSYHVHLFMSSDSFSALQFQQKLIFFSFQLQSGALLISVSQPPNFPSAH